MHCKKVLWRRSFCHRLTRAPRRAEPEGHNTDGRACPKIGHDYPDLRLNLADAFIKPQGRHMDGAGIF
jgi:hypothetical protein